MLIDKPTIAGQLKLPGLFLSITCVALMLGCQTPNAGMMQGGLFDTVRFQDADDPAAFDSPPPVTAEFKAATTANPQIVKEVRITGNQSLAEHHILRQIRTRQGRYFDPDILQQDVNQLWQTDEIRRVNGPYIDHQEDGIVVTIDVVERNYIREVQFIGNRAITDRALKQESGLKAGRPLDLHEIRMAKNRLEEFYIEKGYPNSQISIIEGDQLKDRNVIFLIHEDNLQRISSVQFEGNQFTSNNRLKTLIKSKPGVAWYLGGKVNRREIEQDILRLTAYYRSLGFFNAKIGRELIESDSGKWLTVRYIINEGPRYRVRNVAFVGNSKFSTEQLMSVVKLKPESGESPDFNSAHMNSDVSNLTDLYGSQGHVFVKVQAEPRFLEKPGELDLVYKIEEGKQYRVGKINIITDGGYSVTKRETVLCRLGLRPGDLIDTRLLRASEARLIRAQLWADGSNGSGPPPRIVVSPPELDGLRQADGSSSELR